MIALWTLGASAATLPGAHSLVPTSDPELSMVGLEDGLTFAGVALHPTEELVVVGVRYYNVGACWVPADGADFDPCGSLAAAERDRCIEGLHGPGSTAGWANVKTATGLWSHAGARLELYAVAPDGTVRIAGQPTEVSAILGTIDTPAEALLAARWLGDVVDAEFAWDPNAPVEHDDRGWHLLIWSVDPSSPIVHVQGDVWRRRRSPYRLNVTDQGVVSRTAVRRALPPELDLDRRHPFWSTYTDQRAAGASEEEAALAGIAAERAQLRPRPPPTHPILPPERRPPRCPRDPSIDDTGTP